jgi:hypothetical protein
VRLGRSIGAETSAPLIDDSRFVAQTQMLLDCDATKRRLRRKKGPMGERHTRRSGKGQALIARPLAHQGWLSSAFAARQAKRQVRPEGA